MKLIVYVILQVQNLLNWKQKQLFSEVYINGCWTLIGNITKTGELNLNFEKFRFLQEINAEIGTKQTFCEIAAQLNVTTIIVEL